MKKIIIIILLSAGIFTTSCNDYLNVDPANVKAIGSMEDIKGILAGYLETYKIHYAGASAGNPSSFYHWYDDIGFMLTGEVLQMFSYYDNSMDHTKSLDGINGERYGLEILKALNWSSREVHGILWQQGYKNIGLMNRILEEAAALNEETSELQQQVVGEAKVIRAWNAMKLLQYFTPFTNDALGIPLKFDTEDLVNTEDPRRPQTEVFEMIIADLKEVLTYSAPTNENYNLFYRKNIVNGILAQLYQYKATGPAKADDDWANARMYAKEALANKRLVSNTDELKQLFFYYEPAYFYDTPFASIIFFWTVTGPIQGNSIWGSPGYRDLGYNAYYYTGRPFHPELLALYDEDDIRMEEGMFIWNDLYKENNKWLATGLGRSSRIRNTYHLLRTAELHLIVAESYAREGNDGTAKQWLDEFKASRGTSYYASTDILTEIMNERKKEFCTEYDIIWLDLKRNEMSLTHEYIDPVAGPQTATLESNDYRFAFYIPVDTELSLNPNIEQNPGWSN